LRLIAVDRIPGRRAVAEWPLWRLPPGLRAYVCGLIAATVIVAGWAAAGTSWRARDVVLWSLLTGFGAVAVELGRRLAGPEPAGFIKDIFAAWFLPTAFLLPPVYALAAPVVTFVLLQARVRHTIAHRRVFSAANNGLTLAAVSVTFHALPVSSGQPWWWLLAATGCAAAWLVVSNAVNITAVWLSDRTVSIRDLVLTPAPLLTDVCELAAGVLIAGVIAGVGPVLLIPALPLVAVLQRSFREVQLDTRADPQTGLLHADAWRAETEVQLARAQREGQPLTIGIVHLDLAGDHHGYLARDAALAAAAAIVRASLRPYDLTGRMGQQIVFALPDTTAAEARQAATRLRDGLAAQLDTAQPGQQPARIAVTLGLAATDAPAHTDLTSMLATADAALYRAQQNGQHHVCLDTSPAASGDAPLGPSATPEDYRETIAAAFKARAALLADLREAAGLTQDALRRRIGYSRSTVADAESPECRTTYTDDVWEACDPVLNAKGKLIAATAQIKTLKAAERRLAAEQDRRRHAAAAELAGTGSRASAFALAHGACPHCGKAITGVHVTARITGVFDQHLPDSAL